MHGSALIPPQGRNLFIVDVFHIFDDAITADGRAIVDVAAQPSLTRCKLVSVEIDNLEVSAIV